MTEAERRVHDMLRELMQNETDQDVHDCYNRAQWWVEEAADTRERHAEDN